MAHTPDPIADEVLARLEPLISEAVDAFTRDISYGVAIVAAGRKVAVRKAPASKESAHAA
jgi:hypothetical protein